MKLIETIHAEGQVLCHDLTQIIKGVTKDARFRKGHIVTKEDIPVLLSMGKDHLYVWEKEEGMLHENEGAEILCEICQNQGMKTSDIKEGKIELSAAHDGLFVINREKLKKINSLGEMMIATRHGNTPVHQGDKLAGMRVIPLVIAQEKMNRAKEIAGTEPIFQLLPYIMKKAVVITTGNEVFHGRIEDTFTPVVVDKLKEYGVEVIRHVIVDDNHEKTTEEIIKAVGETDADLILCTGGMSVDPDDRTPLAIKNTGANIVSYGAPVLPGAMFMLAYYDKEEKQIPVMGLPGCVMYAGKTIFDLVLPRILAGQIIKKEELAEYGEGGLCLNCEVCTYPNCGFGK